MRLCVSLFCFLLMAGSVALIAAEKPADKPPTSQPASTQPAPANKKCPVTGEDVDAKGKTVQYKGKTVGFCCDDCIDLFNKNPEKYADRIK
jgi:YHS domain-containing protein